MRSAANILMVLVVGSFLWGCAGEFDLSTTGDTEVSFPDAVVDENGRVTVPGRPGSTADPEPEVRPIEAGFQLERTEVRVLPFHTRMQNLARVTGLPVEDPLFDELRARRYDLGDHNFGEGVGADLSWNASKMAIWVEALRPVCASEAMATRYADLPADLDSLVTNAYGRPVTEADRADFQAVLGSVELSDADRYEAVCLTILTSSEFVAQ